MCEELKRTERNLFPQSQVFILTFWMVKTVVPKLPWVP